MRRHEVRPLIRHARFRCDYLKCFFLLPPPAWSGLSRSFLCLHRYYCRFGIDQRLTSLPIMTVLTSQSVSTLVVSAVFIVLCTLAVALRFQARLTKSMPLKADDHVILMALVSWRGDILRLWTSSEDYLLQIVNVALCIAEIWSSVAINGAGKPISNLTHDTQTAYSKVETSVRCRNGKVIDSDDSLSGHHSLSPRPVLLL